MKPIIGGWAIGHEELAVEGLGLDSNDIYPDNDGGGDEFKEIHSGSELKVDGHL